MEKQQSITCSVSGYPVTLQFTDQPPKDIASRVRSILLDSFIAQNNGKLPLADSKQASQ